MSEIYPINNSLPVKPEDFIYAVNKYASEISEWRVYEVAVTAYKDSTNIVIRAANDKRTLEFNADDIGTSIFLTPEEAFSHWRASKQSTTSKQSNVVGRRRPTDSELAFINSYRREPLKRDEVFMFSCVLCDNEIDADFERIPVESMEKLSHMFVGKSGMINNCIVRIASCSVIPTLEQTKSGDDGFRLVARMYLPVCDENAHLISAISTGLIKNINIGFSAKSTTCSICGHDLNSSECAHVKGKVYDGKLCYGELEYPVEAYDFHFEFEEY